MANTPEARPKALTSRVSAEAMQATTGDGISSSKFVFTDTQSRGNFYALPPSPNEPQSARPSTAGGHGRQQDTRVEPRSAGLPSGHSSMSPRQFHRSAWGSQKAHESPRKRLQMTIGMALGSPSQSPRLDSNGSTGSASPLDPGAIGSFSTAISDRRASIRPEEIIKQKGRWKMFGGLFAKKSVSGPASPAPQFYKAQYPSPGIQSRRAMTPQLQKPPRHRRVSSRSLDTMVPHRVERKRSVREIRARTASKPASVQRSESTPLVLEAARSPTPPPKDYPARPSNNKKLPKIKPLLLEVDIPDVSMERYSVMFGNVLKPRQSSLLVRRQAQLENLKVVDSTTSMENVDKPGRLLPIRRATVPSPVKSASFSLFPSVPSEPKLHPTTPRKASPLHRSATVPSPSPLRANFEFPRSAAMEQAQMSFTLHSPTQSTDTPASPHDHWQSDTSPTSTEASVVDENDCNSPKTVNVIIKVTEPKKLDSTEHFPNNSKPSDRHKGLPVTEKVKQDVNAQPKPHPFTANRKRSQIGRPRIRGSMASNRLPPDLTTPHTSNLTKEPASIKASVPTLTQIEAQKPIPETSIQPTNRPPNPLQSSPASAAEISIARQISISRRQQMRIPIVTKTKTVRQPQQATLVTPGQDEEGPDGTRGLRKGSLGHVSRKSEYGVLEIG